MLLISKDSFRSYNRIPIIGGQDLDLHKLFVEVTSRGGIDKVSFFIINLLLCRSKLLLIIWIALSFISKLKSAFCFLTSTLFF